MPTKFQICPGLCVTLLSMNHRVSRYLLTRRLSLLLKMLPVMKIIHVISWHILMIAQFSSKEKARKWTTFNWNRIFNWNQVSLRSTIKVLKAFLFFKYYWWHHFVCKSCVKLAQWCFMEKAHFVLTLASFHILNPMSLMCFQSPNKSKPPLMSLIYVYFF